jgi:hypothetical protein
MSSIAASSATPRVRGDGDMLIMFSSRSPLLDKFWRPRTKEPREELPRPAAVAFLPTGHADTEDEFMKLYVGNLAYNISRILAGTCSRVSEIRNLPKSSDRSSGNRGSASSSSPTTMRQRPPLVERNGFGGRNLT